MLRLRPIPGALTRSVHSDPQVVVHINGHSATCNATNPRDTMQDPLDPRDADCSFDFASTATPRVKSVFPETGAGGTVITVTLEDAENSRFAFSNESVRVFIGEHAECIVTSVAGNIVMCMVPESGVSPGPVRVRVLVEPWGFAAMHNGSANAHTFTLVSTIKSVHPTQGSIAGGTRLSVDGTGLGTPLDGQDSVKVLLTAVQGNTVVPCPVVSVSASLIECDIPFAGIGITYMVGDYDVSLSVLSNLNRTSTNVVATSSSAFKITNGATPQVSFISPSQISIAGATRVTLVGTGLGDENMTTVNVAGVLPCAIISANDTHVICNSPAHSTVVSRTSSLALTLTVAGKGHAYAAPSNSKVNFVSFPRVDNLTVPMGSSGSRLTIRGEGFDADALSNNIVDVIRSVLLALS